MTATLYPEVLWAQRSGQVFLTVKLADCAKPEIKLEEQSLDFKGTVGDKTYAFTIPFFGPIDLAESKQSVSAREIFFCLQKALPKKEDGTEDTDFEAWWPTLQKGAKLHFVKTDFARWRDEDENSSDEEGMPPMPGGMGGMPGMGGMGGMPGMGGMGGMDLSSMLGGMGGMGGGEGGMPDMSAMLAQMQAQQGADGKMPDFNGPDSDDEEEAAEDAKPAQDEKA